MHAILVLPLLAWLLTLTGWTERRQWRIVLLASVGYALAAGVVAIGNLAGLALSQMPIAAIGIAAIGMLAMLAAWVIALSGVARSLEPP